VVTGAACPRVAALVGDEAPHWVAAMRERAQPAPPAFPDRVCEWSAPVTARFVAVEGRPGTLRLPGPNPRRIVVFGDSGCRGAAVGQPCAHAWPFPRIAAFAAARAPDLVIHVGDYNYRGSRCAAYDGCCDYDAEVCGFPACGDNWDSWDADFFTPAAPLLARAPWVMVRGNHELCAQTGHGFFRYLDPHTPAPQCPGNPVLTPCFTEPYLLSFGAALRLVVLDSANACGQAGFRDHTEPYRRQFDQLAALVASGHSAQTWFVSHRPLWAVLKDTPAGTMFPNYTLRQASGDHLPAAISLLLSGHEHVLQALTFQPPNLPPALLIGTGGAELDNPANLPEHLANLPFDLGGPTVAAALNLHDHGYLLIELRDTSWTATFYDRFDQPLATCDASRRPSVCTPGHP
ncbi:MAG: metallophosphoesterase, partial [Candidatus Binatia bacterium]